MAAAGGVVFQNAKHAVNAYPDLWPSHAALRQALVGRSVSFLYKNDILIEETHTPRSGDIHGAAVTYQVAGAGQKSTKAWFDPLVVPDIADWLKQRLGMLAWCHVDGPEPEPPTAAKTVNRLDIEELPMPPVAAHLTPQASSLSSSEPDTVFQDADPGRIYPPARPENWHRDCRPIVDFLAVKGPFGSFARHPVDSTTPPDPKLVAQMPRSPGQTCWLTEDAAILSRLARSDLGLSQASDDLGVASA